MTSDHGFSVGPNDFGGKSPIEYNMLRPKEDLVPVKGTDLRHLKRDIRDIPDGQGVFDNAFWGFLGLGAPLVIQSVISRFGSIPDIVSFCVGAFAVIVAFIFKALGAKAKDSRGRYVDNIIENIDDYSSGVERT